MKRMNLREFKMALSLFTTIPIGNRIEWNPESMKRIPNYLPSVGLVVGSLSALLYQALLGLPVNHFLKAVLMVLSYLVLTGGFHMDGLMDTCDGHFSRRDLARRLEIMKDSRVGAFAVMGMVMLVLLKTGIFMEIFEQKVPWWQIMTVPVLSRTLLLLLLKKAPYAKDEGLGKMYGDYAQKWDPGAWLVYAGVSALLIWMDPNTTWMVLSGTGCVHIYLWWSKKNFGGITGDLLGAFLEAAEAVLLMTLMLGGWI